MNKTHFDLIIIGGGANGIGTALAAIEKGFRPLLLEANDFAEGTSSKSTKLIHGGIRYLAQGHYALVKEALEARSQLLQQAPDYVQKIEFVIPTTNTWSRLYYFFGLKVYQWLSGKHNLGDTQLLNKAKLIEKLPSINAQTFTGGVSYLDAQFDDALLAVMCTKYINDNGGVALNRHRVTEILKNEQGKIIGVKADKNEALLTFYAPHIVNATGVFTDSIQQLDTVQHTKTVKPSRGTHIVVPAQYLPLNQALVVPETRDGRIIFGVPWKNHIILGTTDLDNPELELEPQPKASEIDFILENVAPFFTAPVDKTMVTSCWTGLRPLYDPGKNEKTKNVNRSHKILESTSGLLSVIGGKWTTFRKIGHDVVDHINKKVVSIKKPFHLHKVENDKKAEMEQLIRKNPSLGTRVHPAYKTPLADIVWHIRHTQCHTPVDYLSRRNRLLFLNAQHAEEAAPLVAQTFAKELNWNIEKMQTMLSSLVEYIQHYQIQAIMK